MIKDVWKKFDKTELHHSSVHHLLAVRTLTEDQGYARATDVSAYLQVSRASVSVTLRKLKEKGYIEEDKNKFLRLSQKGSDLTDAVLSKRHLMEMFFADILGVASETAEADACKVEHLLTDETSAKLLAFTGLYLSDKPIATQYRQEFERHSHHCNDASCPICKEACYFAGREELFNRE